MPRLKLIDKILLSVSSIMIAWFTVAHLMIVPGMRDSLLEAGVVLPPATQFALSTKCFVLVAGPGVALIVGAAISMRHGNRARGGSLIALAVVITFAASAFLVFSLSFVRADPGIGMPETDSARQEADAGTLESDAEAPQNP